MQRTRSMELRAIREQVRNSPPPAPVGTTLREWFAGLALLNPVLMEGIPGNDRAREALRLADELLTALTPPKAPSSESLRPPTEAQLMVGPWGPRDSAAPTLQAMPTVVPLSSAKNRVTHTMPPPSPTSMNTGHKSLRYMLHGDGEGEK